MTAADTAVKGFRARTSALAAADLVDGLTGLTVMLLIDHIALPTSPYLKVERAKVADWAKVHGVEALRSALTAVGAQEAASTGEGPAEVAIPGRMGELAEQAREDRKADDRARIAYVQSVLAADRLIEAEHRDSQADDRFDSTNDEPVEVDA